MILRFIERLREKSRAARKRFAFFAAVAVTAVIGTVWAFSLPARFAGLSNFSDDMLPEDLSANISASSEELQNTINVNEMLPGYTGDRGGAGGSVGDTSPDTPAEAPVNEEPKQPAPRTVIIATSSSEKRD